jgi:orf78
MEVKSMNFNNFQNMCKEKVVDYFNNRVEKTDDTKITIDDVFVVWYCKTLQNAKVLLSTVVSDGMYYELTYNGDKNELYLDAYKKWENKKYDVK